MACRQHKPLSGSRSQKNEIWAIERIPDQLDLEGHTVTIDAMGTENLNWMDPGIRGRWSGLRSLTVVENQTTDKATGRKHRSEKRYYLTCLPADAQDL